MFSSYSVEYIILYLDNSTDNPDRTRRVPARLWYANTGQAAGLALPFQSRKQATSRHGRANACIHRILIVQPDTVLTG